MGVTGIKKDKMGMEIKRGGKWRVEQVESLDGMGGKASGAV